MATTGYQGRLTRKVISFHRYTAHTAKALTGTNQGRKIKNIKKVKYIYKEFSIVLLRNKERLT